MGNSVNHVDLTAIAAALGAPLPLPAGTATEASLLLVAQELTVAKEGKQDDTITALGLVAKDATVSSSAKQDAIILALNAPAQAGEAASAAAGQSTEAKQDAILTAVGLVAKDATVSTAAKQDLQATIAEQLSQTTALGLVAKDATVAKEGKQDAVITALGLVAKDLTVSTAALQTSTTNLIIDELGKEIHLTIGDGVPNYDGTEIEVAGLAPDGRYSLISIMVALDGGTAGNTTQPSLGEATGFTQGDFQDRYLLSTSVTTGAGRQVDVLRPLPLIADHAGKLYIKGAAPAAVDSLLSYRLDLRVERGV